MNATVPTSATALSQLGADNIPDSRGINLYRADPDLGRLLGLYLPAGLKAHLEPHLDRLGALAGDELDELAGTADRNGPELRPRTRRGEAANAIARSEERRVGKEWVSKGRFRWSPYH